MNTSNDSSSSWDLHQLAPAHAATQRGASLLIAIVALVIMTIGGFSLLRSVDTGNVIAGNMAFRASTVNAADTGVEEAAAYINGIQANADGNLPAGCTVGAGPGNLGTCRYTARTQPVDVSGLPYVNWASANIPVATLNGNDVQYVVERLCNPDPTVSVVLGSAPTNDPAKHLCAIEPVDDGSSKASPYVGVTARVEVMYRVTVRVSGPRNTVVTVQSIQAR